MANKPALPEIDDDADQTQEPGDDALEDVVQEAVDRYAYHEEADRDNRKNAKDDTEFVWVRGKQWPEAARREREKDGRPWLEINQLPQFIKQVVNDQRQMRPGIKIAPASGDASKETAELLQGMVRGIENQSNAEAAYDSALEHAVTGGRGYWRICTDYENARSFNQVIKIERIPDPMAVRLDPDYQEPDASDANWCFVEESVSKDDFAKRWPKAKPMDWQPSGKVATWFEGKNKVLVCDYYRRVSVPRTLVYMSDGTAGWKDELPEALPEGIAIQNERESEDIRVEWYKIAGGQQVLEQYEVVGTHIPVVMCVGDEITIGGERIVQGLIRRARDSQTMYNFWQTAATEQIALAPKSPWVAAEGQIEGYENIWKDANKRSVSVLPYKPTSVAGSAVPPPQRTAFAGVPAGIVEQANQCKMDLRSTIGIYDPSLGNRSNETSGRAILAREKQGDNATFHFVDNLSRAIRLTGKIVVEWIPHYYDTQRIVQTMADDDTPDTVEVNVADPITAIVKNDLSSGKYAVDVEAGPSYATKRQESAESMLQFIQAVPNTAPAVAPAIAKNMDWPGADEIYEAALAVLPPAVQAVYHKDKNGQAAALPPAVQQQMQQMQQQLQQMAQENQQLKAGLQEAVAVAKIKQETDIEVAKINAIGKVEVAEINANLQAAQSLMAPAPMPGDAGPDQHPAAAAMAQSQQPPTDRMAELAAAINTIAQGMTAPRHMQVVRGPNGEMSIVSQQAQGIQ